MSLPAVAEDCNIIDVSTRKVLTVSEKIVHHPLECCWNIVQAEWHHFKLKHAKRGGKRCFSLESGARGILPVLTCQIKCGHDCRRADTLFHAWQWICIQHCHLIEFAEVDTESNSCILFWTRTIGNAQGLVDGLITRSDWFTTPQ